MKVFKAMLSTCIVISTLYSCKKDDTAPTPPPPSPRVKTMTSGKYVTTFFYDNQWRANKETTVYSGGATPITTTYKFAYTDTTVTITTYNNANMLYNTIIYKLDAGSGIASSLYRPNNTDQDTYAYTTDKQLRTLITTRTISGQVYGTWTNNYFYSNNNIDSIQLYVDANLTRTDYYGEYATDKMNTIGNENMGQSFLGVSNKNPLTSSIQGTSGAGDRPVYSYTYGYDTQGRITSQIQSINGIPGTPTTYTYY